MLVQHTLNFPGMFINQIYLFSCCFPFPLMLVSTRSRISMHGVKITLVEEI